MTLLSALLLGFLLAPADVPGGVLLHDEREERAFAARLEVLRRRRADFDLREADAGFLAKALEAAGGVDFVVHPALREAEREGSVGPITLRLERVSVLSAMGVLAEAAGIRFLYQHSVFVLTTPAGAKPRVSLRLYSIADLTVRIRDFPGPDLVGLLPPSREPPAPPEPRERPASGLEAEEIADLVRRVAAPGSWEEDPRTSIEVFGTTLAVRQTPLAHREVRQVLAAIRRGC